MEKKKMKSDLAAVIDIGSNVLRMVIGTAEGEKIKVLESLKYPVSLGRDTFSSGSVSYEKINKTCEIIKKFQTEAMAYGVHNICALATTAVREASNRDYMLEQIKVRTGIEVLVLDDTAEKTLIYKEITKRIQKTKQYKNQALVVYVGVGNLGVAAYDNGKIPFAQNIRIGSLRLSEMLLDMQEYEQQYSIVIEDYMRGFTNTFYNDLIKEGEIKHFIACGQEISMIVRLCGGEVGEAIGYITREQFTSLYDDLKNKTAEEIMEAYDLSEESADLLRSAMSIYAIFLRVTTAERIIAPVVFASDVLLYEILKPKAAAEFNQSFEQNTVISAKAVAQRYDYDQEHAEFVEKYSLKIFDKLKKYHGLGKRERLMLQVAAITHDIGKYVNIQSHYNHSYDIIRSSSIVGLDNNELHLIANVVKYHSTIIPNMLDYNYNRLTEKERMTVSKLAAILRIAEALDKGHIKKFEDIELKIDDGTLIIGIRTLSNTQIEEWSFASKKLFFEDVFAMKAVIKKKKVVS